MKLNIKSETTSIDELDIEKIIPKSKRQKILRQAARDLQQNLLLELNQLTLDEKSKQSIAQSIEVNTLQNGDMSLSITSHLAGELEFGTRGRDEQPWMLRASFSVRQKSATKMNQPSSITKVKNNEPKR